MTVRLLDIEGTVCPVSFVKDTLFPYARARIADFVAARAGEGSVAADLRAAAAIAEVDPGDVGGIVAALIRWIDEDRKLTPLKSLQARIWDEGWDSGAFVAPLYPDVAPALRRWRAAGEVLAVFSSGAVPAQRQLFAHTTDGDLEPWFSAFFDTTIGAKRSADAYRAIAAALGVPPAAITFYSDIVEELDAAQDAGCVPRWIVRDPPRVDGAHAAEAVLAD